MSSRSNGSSFNTDAYQLPQQEYVCGHQADGHPCPVGPNGHGECRAQSICVPWNDGTQWHCTRATAFGGRCSEGPVPDADNPDESAVCPHQCAPCQPVRSLRSKRRLVTGLTAAITLGLCLVILGGSSGDFSDSAAGTTAIVSPGPLSAHHVTMSQECSACHSVATQSPANLLSCAFGGSGSIDESHKCLKCHQEFGDHALHPHSIDPARLLASTKQASTQHTTEQLLSRLLTTHKTTDSGQLACATCHKEHQGAEFDLTAMTNTQCQSCHASTFHSFVDGHPEFGERPRARLHFDHVTHMSLHFQNFERLMPGGKARMQCNDCHTPDSSGTMLELGSFDVMCASCHEPQIQDFDAQPASRLHELVFMKGDTNPTDPQNVSPFMELMLSDKAADPFAVQELFTDLATDGEDTLRRRLHMICDQSTETETIEACVRALQESHFFDAVSECCRVMDAGVEGKSADVTYGNWRFDAARITLVYECDRHADPVLKSWIDLLAGNSVQYPAPPAEGSAGVFDRFLREMVAPESTGRCLKCHSVNSSSKDGLTVNWQTLHGHRAMRGFTRFSHKPHLTLLSSDVDVVRKGEHCETCHALTDESFSLVNQAFQLEDGMPNPQVTKCSALGVGAVQRQDCASCHTQSLAGDNCLQCHNYHVHEDSIR